MAKSNSLRDLEKNKYRLTRRNEIVVATIDETNRKTPFDELKVASRYAQIELKSAVDQISNLRNVVETINGSVTVLNTGEYKLETTAVAGAEASLQSGERGRYIPGYEAEAGLGVRVPEQSYNNDQKIEWGYFDANNGLGFGLDNGGIYIFIDRLGTRTVKVYQQDFNKDTCDGSSNENNPSGLLLDPQDGIIYQIEFIWYGYGAVKFTANLKDDKSNRGSVPVALHTVLPDNQTSIAQPNLPISIEIKNGTGTNALEAFVGGRQFSIYGQPSERFRITGERNAAVSLNATSWTPLISARRKTGVGNNQSVAISSVEISPDSAIYYSFVLDGALTGASFGSLTDFADNETTLEADVSATAITGGTFFGGIHLAQGDRSGAAVATVLANLDFEFVGLKPVTLVGRSVSGAATADAVAFNLREQW